LRFWNARAVSLKCRTAHVEWKKEKPKKPLGYRIFLGRITVLEVPTARLARNHRKVGNDLRAEPFHRQFSAKVIKKCNNM
jgi:hypothetical protein